MAYAVEKQPVVLQTYLNGVGTTAN